ncbi:MAG: hypothetical protein AAGA80_26405 [Cyanobacteria bacterium P01_F01_bin.143]
MNCLIRELFDQELFGAPLSDHDSFSDHCAISVTLDLSDNRGSDEVTKQQLLDRLAQLDLELQELRNLIENLDLD